MNKNSLKNLILVIAIFSSASSGCVYALEWKELQRNIETSIELLHLGHHSIETRYHDEGKLTITGYVASIEDQTKLISALSALEGVSEVENKLMIEGSSVVVGSPQDESLRKTVLEAIKKQKGLGSYEVDLVMNDTTLTINGSASSEEDKKRIENAAKQVAGVGSVVNNLVVKIIPDSVLEQNVWKALKGESDLDITGIGITVSKGVVTVSGTRPDHLKVDRILSIVNMADGVKDIKSQMKVAK